MYFTPSSSFEWNFRFFYPKALTSAGHFPSDPALRITFAGRSLVSPFAPDMLQNGCHRRDVRLVGFIRHFVPSSPEGFIRYPSSLRNVYYLYIRPKVN
jgi:hypothetical protein